MTTHPVHKGKVHPHVVDLISEVNAFGSIDKNNIVKTLDVVSITALKNESNSQ